jgi:hypothetical protein
MALVMWTENRKHPVESLKSGTCFSTETTVILTHQAPVLVQEGIRPD